MARTKQTARKSTGGKAPRKVSYKGRGKTGFSSKRARKSPRNTAIGQKRKTEANDLQGKLLVGEEFCYEAIPVEKTAFISFYLDDIEFQWESDTWFIQLGGTERDINTNLQSLVLMKKATLADPLDDDETVKKHVEISEDEPILTASEKTFPKHTVWVQCRNGSHVIDEGSTLLRRMDNNEAKRHGAEPLNVQKKQKLAANLAGLGQMV